MRELKGIVCAAVTPMDAHGNVDDESVASLTRYLREAGIDGVYPNGTNGESLSLTEAERREVAQIVVRESAGGPAVYMQCGSCDIRQTVRLIRHAQEIGADGAGVMTPAFFKCDDQAMEEYYDAVCAQVTDFPIYLYNIPPCTGNDLRPGVMRRLMEKHHNIRGIKFSAPDMMRIREYLTATPNVLLGCDALVLDCLMAGGAGTVSGPAAIFAERFVRLYREYLAGDFAAARQTQTRVFLTAREMNGIPEIPAIKMVLKWRGIIKNEACRAPLRKLTAQECGRLEKLLDDYAVQK